MLKRNVGYLYEDHIIGNKMIENTPAQIEGLIYHHNIKITSGVYAKKPLFNLFQLQITPLVEPNYELLALAPLLSFYN